MILTTRSWLVIPRLAPICNASAISLSCGLLIYSSLFFTSSHDWWNAFVCGAIIKSMVSWVALVQVMPGTRWRARGGMCPPVWGSPGWPASGNRGRAGPLETAGAALVGCWTCCAKLCQRSARAFAVSTSARSRLFSVSSVEALGRVSGVLMLSLRFAYPWICTVA
jgi:hypothetical protein